MTFHRRERPQLVFDGAGKPTHLINGVLPPQAKGGQNDYVYSLVRHVYSLVLHPSRSRMVHAS
jgi:hypothetical protein